MTELEEQPMPSVVADGIEDGKWYSTRGPGDVPCVIMSHTTWVNYGTMLESFRGVATSQDRRIKELLAENKILTAQNVDTRNRLENLRAVRRAEKRPEVEAMLDIPQTPPGKGN